MRYRKLLLFALVAFVASVRPVAAQQACPCVPLSKLWITTVCDSWNCASSELILANGDHSVFVIPVTGDATEHRWLVVRQVTAGVYNDTSPFQVDAYDSVYDASARFSGMAADKKPMMTTAPDGKLLVLSLRELGKSRSVAK